MLVNKLLIDFMFIQLQLTLLKVDWLVIVSDNYDKPRLSFENKFWFTNLNHIVFVSVPLVWNILMFFFIKVPGLIALHIEETRFIIHGKSIYGLF